MCWAVLPNTTHWNTHSEFSVHFERSSLHDPESQKQAESFSFLPLPWLLPDVFSKLSEVWMLLWSRGHVPRRIIPWPPLLYGHWLSAQWQTQPPLCCSSISPDCHLNTEDFEMETSDLRTPPTQTSPQHLCYLFLGYLTLCECHIVRCLHAGYPDVMDGSARWLCTHLSFYFSMFFHDSSTPGKVLELFLRRATLH